MKQGTYSRGGAELENSQETEYIWGEQPQTDFFDFPYLPGVGAERGRKGYSSVSSRSSNVSSMSVSSGQFPKVTVQIMIQCSLFSTVLRESGFFSVALKCYLKDFCFLLCLCPRIEKHLGRLE